ncbi:glyoxalase/bleomycin resistance/extradiol dioxygenase family protein [Flavobacterium rakeshii]|uniref:Glyoxalase/bleomycin resistance/extradiol dioxygenase family protein n=1 Tax=Flavobacterium rakeshii TaxID=1038845 RepID=A0A6N8HH26_9FLAO|nr:VOC family protein [Flavobacterium rakeshii]MEE1899337.1 VOC family protein [Flavobacterium rakeshii]MUV05042.1 glyoxalase/bleomycin resistance/extradiol dioxygenase family protein [Flavobacterium rakeshii]
MTKINQIFINLPVNDLNKSIEFFTKVGFTFNPQFTDENATCMIIGENMYAMLLTEKYFSTFITKPIADAKKATEVITALSVSSRDEVESIIEKAFAAGGKQYKDPIDYGWMYNRNFEDLDGHQWEIFYMDMSAMPTE